MGMHIQRRRAPVTIMTAPRTTLAYTHHKQIDVILKGLKSCSRRLKVVLDGFKDELRTLERLYYKCKNQHRMALFFKRVPELRRYGRRLSELEILDRVDLLRASFLVLEHTNDRKALRGSWSHMPEKPYIHFLIERLTGCSTLTCKMRERLGKAYHHFTLAMQTGAFVQLIVLFVAITSRMFVLSSQLEEVLQSTISTCNCLLGVIHSTSKYTSDTQQTPLEPEVLSTSHDDHVVSEDTGQPVSCYEPINISTSVYEDLSLGTEATLEIRVNAPASHPTASNHSTAQASRKSPVKVAQKPRPKKIKKKLDEIDEIFGF